VLTKQQTTAILSAARGLSIDALPKTVEDFTGTALGLDHIRTAALFPIPDPHGTMERITAELTKQREQILREDVAVPNYVVSKNAAGSFQVIGLTRHLQQQGEQPATIARIRQHERVRTALFRLGKGHDLEALAGALMKEWLGSAAATRRSNDEGVDALGFRIFSPVSPSMSRGDTLQKEAVAYGRLFVLASSKASLGTSPKARQKLLNPAHIRELVGSWVIQRSEVGAWQSNGIRQLSPMQMVLVTTYRLSEKAKKSCFDLGVGIWSIPELIYLICKYAPNSVFPPAPAQPFGLAAFNLWWKSFDQNRTN
jgi:hypothetical protein